MTRRAQLQTFAFTLCMIGFLYNVTTPRELTTAIWCAIALTAAAS